MESQTVGQCKTVNLTAGVICESMAALHEVILCVDVTSADEGGP